MGNRIEVIPTFRTKFFSNTIARSTGTTAYQAGDVISEVTTNNHHTFGAVSDGHEKRVGRPGINTGMIIGANLVCSSNQVTLDAELWLFWAALGEVADNAAFAPTDAEMLTCIGVIDFASGDWKVGNAGSGADGNSICTGSRGGNFEFQLPYRTTDSGLIYGQLVVRAAYTPVASETYTPILAASQD